MFSKFLTSKLFYLFQLFDVDKNGVLQKRDFELIADKVRTQLGYEENSKEHLHIASKSVFFFKKITSELVVEKKDEIKIVEWLEFFRGNVIENQDEIELAEFVQLLLGFIFGVFDENHDGYLSLKEYQEIFHIFGINRSESLEVYKKLDYNGDDKLSRYELSLAVETFLISNDESELGNWIFGNWKNVEGNNY